LHGFDACTNHLITMTSRLVPMKKKSLPQVLAVATILVFPSVLASQNVIAHEERLYTIGDKDYWITVGSINEPVFIDDKSGAEAFIALADPADPLNSDSNGTTNVEGLEKTIKFEISAGDKKKEIEVEPAWQDPGHYEATFYPTIETTYNYRLFGAINNVTVSLDFQCALGEVGEEESQDNSTKQISEGVTLKAQRGGFGCPASRADVGFPEPYVSDNELVNMIKELSGNSTSK
jgi:hypothetical protein